MSNKTGNEWCALALDFLDNLLRKKDPPFRNEKTECFLQGLLKFNLRQAPTGAATNGSVREVVAWFFEFSRNVTSRKFQKTPHFVIQPEYLHVIQLFSQVHVTFGKDSTEFSIHAKLMKFSS